MHIMSILKERLHAIYVKSNEKNVCCCPAYFLILSSCLFFIPRLYTHTYLSRGRPGFDSLMERLLLACERKFFKRLTVGLWRQCCLFDWFQQLLFPVFLSLSHTHMHTEETSRVLEGGGVTQAVARATVMWTKASKETATRQRESAAARYKQHAPM